MRSISPEMRRILSRASSVALTVDQHGGAVRIGLGGGERLVELVRKRSRHLPEPGKLARLDEIGLGLAQLLLGQPPLGDLLLDAAVDAGKIGRALLDALLQLVARLGLHLHALGKPRPPLAEDGQRKPCKAEKEQRRRRCAVRAWARTEPVSISTFTVQSARRHVLREHQIFARPRSLGHASSARVCSKLLRVDRQRLQPRIGIAPRRLGALQTRSAVSGRIAE